MAGKTTQCSFCALLGREQYVCPRCKAPYCSLRCYKSEAHRECSESFYRDCVNNELKVTQFEAKVRSNQPTTFDEYMRTYAEDCSLSKENDSRLQDGAAEEELGEPLDSDDEDVKYLKEVMEDTVAEFEDADEEDLERRLTALGIGTDPDKLYDALSEAEKAAFLKLVDHVNYEESDFGKSVFRKTKNSSISRSRHRT